MNGLAAVMMVLVVVLGIPFVLWWWKLADKWADDESRKRPGPAPRKKPSADAPTTGSERPRDSA